MYVYPNVQNITWIVCRLRLSQPPLLPVLSCREGVDHVLQGGNRPRQRVEREEQVKGWHRGLGGRRGGVTFNRTISCDRQQHHFLFVRAVLSVGVIGLCTCTHTWLESCVV